MVIVVDAGGVRTSIISSSGRPHRIMEALVSEVRQGDGLSSDLFPFSDLTPHLQQKWELFISNVYSLYSHHSRRRF